MMASEHRERGQVEGDGTSPGAKPVDPFITSLIMSVFISLAGPVLIGVVWLARKLIGWKIRRRVDTVRRPQSRARP